MAMRAMRLMMIMMTRLHRVLTTFQQENSAISYMGFRDTKLTRLLQPLFERPCFVNWLICISTARSVVVGDSLFMVGNHSLARNHSFSFILPASPSGPTASKNDHKRRIE